MDLKPAIDLLKALVFKCYKPHSLYTVQTKTRVHKLTYPLELVYKAASYLKVSPADSDSCLMGILGSGTYESNKCTVSLNMIGPRQYYMVIF